MGHQSRLKKARKAFNGEVEKAMARMSEADLALLADPHPDSNRNGRWIEKRAAGEIQRRRAAPR